MHTSALKNFTPSHPQHRYRHLHTHTHMCTTTPTHTQHTHTCVWPHTTHTHTHINTCMQPHQHMHPPPPPTHTYTQSTSQSPSPRACTVLAADFQTWFTTPWLWFHHNLPGSASSPHAVHILLNVSGEVIIQDVAAKSSIKIQQSASLQTKLWAGAISGH